ncbi:MAG: hypothetical protein JW908_09255 [Anaerolineales bacterium]|nr:hypothetical protein [Anaerolineales bacterium]
MQKEVLLNSIELENCVRSLTNTFIQRWDLYPLQLNDGSYVCIKKTLTMSHILSHLKGEITLGCYVLNEQSEARFIVFDADDQPTWDRLIQMSTTLSQRDIPSYLETSRRGGHLWIFFWKSIPGKTARSFGKRLLKQFDFSTLELFPKQNELKTGPGSLVRLPFGIHRKTGERYGFITPDGKALANKTEDQINILTNPCMVTERAFRKIMHDPLSFDQKPVPIPIQESSESLSSRIKDSITVYDFVCRYVDISPTGRGLCPFHDDQHESFAVNLDENYWCCFAECGGGSIIDFWMKWKSCDFKSAIRDLAHILL